MKNKLHQFHLQEQKKRDQLASITEHAHNKINCNCGVCGEASVLQIDESGGRFLIDISPEDLRTRELTCKPFLPEAADNDLPFILRR